VGCNLMTNQE